MFSLAYFVIQRVADEVILKMHACLEHPCSREEEIKKVKKTLSPGGFESWELSASLQLDTAAATAERMDSVSGRKIANDHSDSAALPRSVDALLPVNKKPNRPHAECLDEECPAERISWDVPWSELFARGRLPARTNTYLALLTGAPS